MENLEEWSVVLKTVIEIKRLYFDKHGYVQYDFGDTKTIDGWLESIENEYYSELFKPLQINQKGKYVLIRYGRYSDVFSGESEYEYGSFWDSHNGFYRQCRSIVIDIVDEVVVITPFDKFFNVGENDEVSFEVVAELIKNSNNCEISDKLDGSMQCGRYYNGDIMYSGSQSIDIENSWRLKLGYDFLIGDDNYVNMLKYNPTLTFIFELISLEDAHVVNYLKDDEGIYLIGVRDVLTGIQYPYNKVIEFAKKYNVKSTKLFNKTFEDIVSELDMIKSNVAEGFVLNVDGKMFKIKYDDYVKTHKVLSNITSTNLIILSIAEDKFDDLIAKIPNAYKERVLALSKIIFSYVKKIDIIIRKNHNLVKNMELKEAMVFIQNNIEKEYRGYVIEAYKHGFENLNYLKSKNGHVKKMSEIEKYG
jgi:hypothetical protein